MSPEDRAKAELTDNLDVSRETLGLLEAYVELLKHWQKTTNLVAPSTLPHIWSRHILDSAQLLVICPGARRWLDLGSGGGLPGLVLACQLKKLGGSIELVESNLKKAAFLRHVAASLDLPVKVHAERIEQALSQVARPDIVTARALTALPGLIGYTKHLLKSRTVALFPKGGDYQAELTEAARHWHFSYELHASRTDPEARIIKITSLG